jgi:pseudouridine-5'-phosphate glycosidase
MAARAALGEQSALLVANPLPPEQQLDPAVLNRALTDALRAAADDGIRGKAVSPFLLDYIVRATGGASLEVNLRLVRSNIALAGQIALALPGR